MKVVKKQCNSKHCIICGLENPSSVKAPFYEMEDNSVVSLFSFNSQHQSYPGRVHGGMITSMLDELIGRVIWCYEPEALAVTMEINVKFRKPVPYDVPLIGVATLEKNTRRAYTAQAYIKDADGNVLAQGTATYMKLTAGQITDADMHEELDVFIPDDVTEINI